jgi:hypothetical protein
MSQRAATARSVLLGACLAALALPACHHAAGQAPDAGPVDAGDAGAHDAGQSGGDGGASTDGGGADAGVLVILNAVYPGQGPAAGGTPVLVTGSGFVEGFASRGGGVVSRLTQVRVGGALAGDIDVIDDNRLQLTIPPGTPGAADVSVTNPNGTGTCAGCFRYLSKVVIASITPAKGLAAGGTPVTIQGHGFAPGMLVTLGGVELIGVSVQSGTTLTGLTPPGAPGAVELVCATRDGGDTARSAFVYQEPLAIAGATPRALGLAGGPITVKGHGFGPRAQVEALGAALATTWVSDQALRVVAPAAAEGPVDLAVVDPDALPSADLPQASPPRTVLARGLVYLPAAGSGPGPLALDALDPRHGPLAGGTCPGDCLTLTGSGLSQPDLVVTIGGAQVAAGAVHVDSDQALRIDLPAGSAPGPVDVAVSSAAAGAQAQLAAADPGAFRYDPPLSLTQVAPSSGPAAGGTPFTLSGAGLATSPGAPLVVRVGALPATQVVVAGDGASLTAVTPAGAPGGADVTVVATDEGGWQRSAVLKGGYSYSGALALYQVEPPSGAQSGGAEVLLRGRGFSDGLAVRFGSNASTQVTVLSPSEARCVVPAGVPGAVAVQAGLHGQSDTLPAGFTYFDPQTNAGGTGGGPLLGALNVTVIDATPYIDGNVAGANVEVQFASGASISAVTDGRGQVTLSDPRLVTPVQVTVSKALYTAVTVTAHQTANLTVWLSGPIPPPPPPGDPPPPPPPPQKATIAGHVYGFKAPPDLVLSRTQRLVAYVRLASTSVWASPPFSPPQTPIVIDRDGGGFSFDTTRLSATTLTAMYGVEDNLGPNLTTFTPLLLGVKRDLMPNPDQPITDADLILDTHLDQQATATLIGVPPPVGTNTVVHQAGVVLDLGSSGYVPLSSVTGVTGGQITFPRLPASAGQGFVFIDQVVSGPAVSIYLRRIFGDVLGGFLLGPYLPFPVPQSPPDLGTLPADFDWTFRWSLNGNLAPNLLQLRLDGNGFSWSVVLPGDARSVVLPESLRDRVRTGKAFNWQLTASLAPGFDYTYWSYYDLYGGAWTAYAYGSAQFQVPQ